MKATSEQLMAVLRRLMADLRQFEKAVDEGQLSVDPQRAVGPLKRARRSLKEILKEEER